MQENNRKSISLLLVIGSTCLGSAAQAAEKIPGPPGEWLKVAPGGCMLWSERPRNSKDVLWSGLCQDGKAHGEGTMLWKVAPSRYYSYSGNWVLGVLGGKGFYSDGVCEVSGEFANNLPDGQAELRCPDYQYSGRMQGLHKHGFGTETRFKRERRHAVPHKAAAARIAGVQRGWWENSRLRFACATEAQCLRKEAADDARQAGLVAARPQPPFLWLSGLSGRPPYKTAPYLWRSEEGPPLRQGRSNKNGQIPVVRDATSNRYVLETPMLRQVFVVPPRCWQRLGRDFPQCVRLERMETWPQYEQQQQDKAQRLAHEEKQRQWHEAQRQASEDEYRQARLSDDDELRWLGPLPAEWTTAEAEAGTRRLQDSIERMLAAEPERTLESEFHCTAVQKMGELPDMQAVSDFVAAEDDESGQPPAALWPPLLEAARKGNWLARFYVYLALDQRHEADEDGKAIAPRLLASYRQLQLMEWLHQQRIGPLYSYLSGREHRNPTRTRYFSFGHDEDMPSNLFAIDHGAYLEMDALGSGFLQAGNPLSWQRKGLAMRECAHKMMPLLFRD